LEIAGIRKQYSGQKTAGFFPAYSCQFPVLSGRNRSEIIGKNSKISDWNTASKKSLGSPRTDLFRAGLLDLGSFDGLNLVHFKNLFQYDILIQSSKLHISDANHTQPKVIERIKLASNKEKQAIF
jgi:hypothetical protein